MNKKRPPHAPTPVPVPVPLPTARAMWWLHPSAIVCIFLIPTYLLLWLAGWITNGTVSTAKSVYFLKGDIAILGLIGLLTLALGTFSPIRATPLAKVATRKFTGPNTLVVIGLIALVGYVYWFKDLLLHPGAMLAAIKNSGSVTYAIRTSIERSAGIASLAQMGLAYMVLYAHSRWAGGAQYLQRRHHLLLIALVLATVFRVFAWGERLALIEIAVALGFVWVAYAPLHQRWVRRTMPWMPLLGVAGVLVLFAVAEYFRSWSSHYASTHISFGAFILQRLTNYYFTALNTGAGVLTMYDWPTYNMTTVMLWVHKLPLIGPVFSYLVHVHPGEFMDFLDRYGDAEFNNPSGLFPIFSDLGIVGGLILLIMLGAISKYTYSIWQNRGSIGGAMYFLFLMTYLELFRYFYLGSPRWFMVALGFAMAIINSVEVNDEHAQTTQIPNGYGRGRRFTAA